MNKDLRIARLYSSQSPSEKQSQGFLDFLLKKTGRNYTLEWVEDNSIEGGFRLEADELVYDWSIDGRLKQLKSALDKVDTSLPEYIPLMKRALADWKPHAIAEEVGRVVSLYDGVALINGLKGVRYGEILFFEGGEKGLAQDIDGDTVSCILFDDEAITSGDRVYRSGRTAGIPVSDEIIGRVVDALGMPVDGKGSLKSDAFMPIEHAAPAIIDRSPVNEPLKTGILTIDAMFPIGKGQRELIIGDRQTGKTTIATDTILNQKGKDVLCVYVAIGQKASTVKRIVRTLEEHGAMEYTTVVLSAASDSAPLQYIAPYSGCAIAEYFMNKGRDVLIVYDDLSKHAVAYRTLSLLLGRSPGREAYPGDIFYLHSRLLERSAKLSEAKGGGSMTALPIVETLSGDVSAYIPTNIISITDGQLFLESSLFYAGQRPAINVGLSVSRVGGSAQTKAMKKAVGTLRLELAQYREMKTFTQFSGELEDSVKQQFLFGRALTETLIQPSEAPYAEWEEIVMLVASLGKTTVKLNVADIRPSLKAFCEYFKSNCSEVVSRLERDRVLKDEDRLFIIKEAEKFFA